MPETSTLKDLSLDLSQSEREIIYEFTRARQIMEVLQMPGWEHINDLFLSKIDRIQAMYLEMKNIKPEALWAMHIAQQYVADFWNAGVAQLRTTGDFLKDPEAVQAMLSGAAVPEVVDLEGEVNSDMPRFSEEQA